MQGWQGWRAVGSGGQWDVAVAQGVGCTVVAWQEFGGLAGDGASDEGSGKGERVVAGEALRLAEAWGEGAGGSADGCTMRAAGEGFGEDGVHVLSR